MSTQDLFAWCCPLSPAAGPTFSLRQWPCPVWPSPTTQALGSDLTAVACSPRPWCHQFLSPGHFYQHTNTRITQFEQCRPCPLRQALPLSSVKASSLLCYNGFGQDLRNLHTCPGQQSPLCLGLTSQETADTTALGRIPQLVSTCPVSLGGGGASSCAMVPHGTCGTLTKP